MTHRMRRMLRGRVVCAVWKAGRYREVLIPRAKTVALLFLNDNTDNSPPSRTDSFFTFQVSTDAIEDLPQAGAPVYLELDYKCNTTFLVGVYVNYPLVVRKDLLFINPKEDWNKIYINLTGTISESINAPSFSIFVEMMRDFDQTENEIYLDNFKIVY